MIQKNIEKISENVIDSDNSVVNDIIKHYIFAFITEQAQKYSDYFALMTSTCFQCHSQSHSQHHLYK